MNVISSCFLSALGTISFPTNEGLLFLNATDIISIKSDENYCFVEHLNGREFVLLPLKKIEASMDATRYFRCHRSYIVNLEKIKTYDKVMNQLLMSNGDKIPVSRIRKSELLKNLATLYNL